MWVGGLTGAVYAPLAYYMWPHSTPYQVTVQGLRMAHCLWTVRLRHYAFPALILDQGLTISLDYYFSLHWEDDKSENYKKLRQEVRIVSTFSLTVLWCG